MAMTLLRAFQRQVLLQCEFVPLAATDVNRFLKHEPMNPSDVFYAVQNLLNAAANVSKALWVKAPSCRHSVNFSGTALEYRTPLRCERSR
jgi:hypothetical protein